VKLDLSRLTIAAAAGELRRRSFSATELVEACLCSLEAVSRVVSGEQLADLRQEAFEGWLRHPRPARRPPDRGQHTRLLRLLEAAYTEAMVRHTLRLLTLLVALGPCAACSSTSDGSSGDKAGAASGGQASVPVTSNSPNAQAFVDAHNAVRAANGRQRPARRAYCRWSWRRGCRTVNP